ncbi:hypothetical protein [Streptomyces sp. NPDC002516]
MAAAFTGDAFFAAAFAGAAFFAAAFAGAVSPAADFAGVTFLAVPFADVTFLAVPFADVTFLAVRGAVFFVFSSSAAFAAAPDTAFTGTGPAAFVGSLVPSGACSPTAESRRTATRPAPLACALTGDLDTRPA